jgi:parvulin-like peptidyl-prolyl isomerase
MKRARLSLVVVALLAAVETGLVAQSSIVQQIIVKVNGEIFTLTELTQRQIQALRDKNRMVDKPADLENDATLRTMLATLTPDILVSAVDELLIVQRGRELGFRLTDDQFKSVVESVKKDNKLDDAAFKVALTQEGLTMDLYRQMMERQMIIQKVQQDEVMQHATLTDEESRQYYQAHPAEFTTAPKVSLREIFIAVPTTTRGMDTVFNADVDAAAKAKAAALRARITGGEPFAQVATEASESTTKDKGGLMGPVNLPDMNPALRDIIQKLKVGETSEPVRTGAGWQLFMVDTETAATLQPFDKVRDQISQRVYAERLDGETKKYLDKLRTQALIEWKHDEMKKMYEKRVAEAKGKVGG